MAGKYSKLRGIIPTFVEEESYQSRVNEEKLKIVGDASNVEAANVTRLASLFAASKQIKDSLEEKISFINLQLEALSQLLVEALEDQEIQKVELSSGALVFLQDTPYPQVKDKELVLAWIKKNRMTQLLGVNYQTLKGLTNELLVAGKKLPDGVEVFLKTQARVRGAGKNGDE